MHMLFPSLFPNTTIQEFTCRYHTRSENETTGTYDYRGFLDSHLERMTMSKRILQSNPVLLQIQDDHSGG